MHSSLMPEKCQVDEHGEGVNHLERSTTDCTIINYPSLILGSQTDIPVVAASVSHIQTAASFSCTAQLSVFGQWCFKGADEPRC